MTNEAEPGVAPVVWARGMHTGVGESVDIGAYDRYLGRWSRLFLPALIEAAACGRGDRVLDVATGPGDAALAVRAVVDSEGMVIGCDIAPAMARAASQRSGGTLPVVADAQRLPFRDGTFDAVICQLGLMFFPSPRDALVEFARIVRPGGRVAVGVLSTPERAAMWGVLAAVLSGHLPGQHDVFHLSFSLADPDTVTELFTAAGYRDVHVEGHVRGGVCESLDDYWEPIERGIGQLPHAYCSLPEPVRRRVRDEVNDHLAPYRDGGRLVMSVEALIATGQTIEPRPADALRLRVDGA
jgi:ubiquinone/menaquinone biosynthesis C-methylase UbiE